MQHKAAENIWSVCVLSSDGSVAVKAYINLYVDDILYVGEIKVIEATDLAY